MRNLIHIFNRRELLMTYDLRQVSDLRELLRANRIDYYVKVTGPRSPASMGAGRNRMYSFGHDHHSDRYTVYVHKADWEYAMYLLRK